MCSWPFLLILAEQLSSFCWMASTWDSYLLAKLGRDWSLTSLLSLSNPIRMSASTFPCNELLSSTSAHQFLLHQFMLHQFQPLQFFSPLLSEGWYFGLNLGWQDLVGLPTQVVNSAWVFYHYTGLLEDLYTTGCSQLNSFLCCPIFRIISYVNPFILCLALIPSNSTYHTFFMVINFRLSSCKKGPS